MWGKVIAAGAVILGLAGAGRGAEPVMFSGTFQDVNGHKGPTQCALTAQEAGKWIGKFDSNNTGTGPNKPLSCTLELVAKEEGGATILTGEWQSRAGLYLVTATLMPRQRLKASFKRKEGGGEGTFEMTPVKSTELSPAPAK